MMESGSHACLLASPTHEQPQASMSRALIWVSFVVQAECVQHGLRTIAFCKTRKMCELVTAYTRETLKDTAPHLANTISVYRAGYSPEVRATSLPRWMALDFSGVHCRRKEGRSVACPLTMESPRQHLFIG